MSTLLPMIGIPVVRFLSDALGNSNAIGNYASQSTDFFHEVPAGHVFTLHSLCIQISDNSAFNQKDYGAIVNGLVNGVSFYLISNGVEIPLLSNQIIKHNNDWARITSDLKLTQWAVSSQTLIANLSPDNRMGLPFTLSSVNNERFIARLRDDFSGLIDHTFALGGVLSPVTML